MRVILKLTVASIKMYFRQREAIIWSFILPLFIVSIFAFVRFDGLGTIHLGIVDESGGIGSDISNALRNVETFKTDAGSRDHELAELQKGERDLVFVIPPTLGGGDSNTVLVFTNEERVQQAQIGVLVLQRFLDERLLARTPVAGRILVHAQPVKSRNLSYIDFLLPGILAMSIMQMGIFGVAFGFVSLKKRGILRRLSVTPVRPADFIIAQVVTRVLVLMIQIGLMVAVGMLLLHFHFSGNLFSMFLIGALGAIVFLSFGFAIAGISKSEDQVAPLANIITLPLLFLSGVFFSRSTLPEFLRRITDFSPLTHLADAMRAVAIDGATLMDVRLQLVGLVVWGVLACVLAIKLFRWE
jgi:ABC-2 type transport system permease protein